MKKSRGVILGLALLTLALTVALSASREVAASPTIELRQAFLGGYGLPVYNNAFMIQIASYGFGYGFAPGTTAYFRLSLVKESLWGSSQVFSANENAVITFGSAGSRCLFQVNKYYYIAKSYLPQGSYNVHWVVTLIVGYQGHTYTTSMNSNSMKIVNQ